MPSQASVALAGQIREALAGQADPVRAVGQQAYMKSAMPFYGVPVPKARALVRVLSKESAPSLGVVAETSRLMWDDAQFREERYAALALTGLPVAKGRLELVALYEHQVVSGAWWDFTDEIAHRIADLHDAHPVETAAIVRRWACADCFWLRRLAILSQLQRKRRTDTALLAEVIKVNAADAEFFIHKAIGWALRNYAFTDPAWVQVFVNSHDLSRLSRAEALKHF